MEAPGSPYASSPESAPKRAPRSSPPPPQDRPDADHDAAEPQDDKEKPTHLRFLVSNTAAGCIIGKGGSTINDFQSQSGARIQLSRSHEFFPGTNDRIIMVSGLFDEVVKAMELVLEKLLSEGEESNEAEARPKFRLVVPNSSCGGIIGKGGATIKSFIEDSHAGIKISPQDNNFVGLHDRLVTITGPLNSQMRAIFLILSKLSEDVHYPPNLSSPFPYAGLGFLRPSHGDDDKNNVAKKQYHHHTGSGGYLKVRPLWDKAENDLIAKGVEPETLNWPGRLRTWFFGVGGTLDPKTGKCRWTDEQLAIPVKKLQKYITAAQEETFIPDREKDELTEALRNPEHPGRTRGTPGSVPWKVGFPDAGGYRSRERKRKAELSDMQKVNARLEKLEELVSQRSAGQPGTPGSVPWKVGFPDAGGYRSRERKRKAELSDMQKLKARLEKLEEQFESQRAIGQPSQRHEATPEATPPSQRRSSVASTEFVQPDFTAPSYPVDTITEAQPCELMGKLRNLAFKVAVGSVVPPQPNGTFHCLLIPYDYAVVTVDEVIEGFEELELDYPTGEGENQLVHVLRSTCLWRKECIKLPNWTPPPPPPPPASQGTPPPQQTQAESSPVRQPSPPPQGTPTEEAPQQKPPPPQLSPPRHRTPPPPLKRVAAASAASSSTKQRRFRYG